MLAASTAPHLSAAPRITATMLGASLHIDQSERDGTIGSSFVVSLTSEQNRSLRGQLIQKGAIQDSTESVVRFPGSDKPTRDSARFVNADSFGFRDLQLSGLTLMLAEGKLSLHTPDGRTASIVLSRSQTEQVQSELTSCFESTPAASRVPKLVEAVSPEAERMLRELGLGHSTLPKVPTLENFSKQVSAALNLKFDLNTYLSGTVSQRAYALDHLKEAIYQKIHHRREPLRFTGNLEVTAEMMLARLTADSRFSNEIDWETGAHFIPKDRKLERSRDDVRLTIRPECNTPEQLQQLMTRVSNFVLEQPTVRQFKFFPGELSTRRDPIVLYLGEGASSANLKQALADALGELGRVGVARGLRLNERAVSGTDRALRISPTEVESFDLAFRILERVVGAPIPSDYFGHKDSAVGDRVIRAIELLNLWKSK